MTGRKLPRAVLLPIVGVPVVVGGLAVGAGLAAVGASAGPAMTVELVVVAVLAALVLDAPILGVALLLASIPVGLLTLPIGFVLIQGVAMLAVGATVLSRLAAGLRPLLWSAPLWWGLLVGGLMIVSTPNAISTTAAVKQVADVFLGIGVVLTAITVTGSFDRVRRLVHVLLAVGGVVSLLSLSGASHLRSVSNGAAVENRLQGVFTEPNQFGSFAAIILLLAIGVAMGARSHRERTFAAVVATPAALALLLALSRGAWLGTLVGIGLFLWVLPATRRIAIMAVVALLLLVPAVGLLTADAPQVQVVRQRIGTVGAPVANPYDSRPAIWREAEREIADSPWLGQGPGQFPIVSQEAASPAASVYADHAHNVLLTVAAEAGIPAALALIGFTLSIAVVLRRTVRRLIGTPDAALVAGVGASLGVVVGQGLVDYTLRNAVIFLVLSVLVGLVLSAHRLTSSRA